MGQFENRLCHPPISEKAEKPQSHTQSLFSCFVGDQEKIRNQGGSRRAGCHGKDRLFPNSSHAPLNPDRFLFEIIQSGP